MSELKVIKIELNNHGKPIASIQGTASYYGIYPNDTFYPKSEADKVIAEKDKKIAELTAKNKRLEEFKDKYSGCAKKAINTIAKCELKIRMLSRALFKACANWARFEGALFADEYEAEKWRKIESKCLKKAEEYK